MSEVETNVSFQSIIKICLAFQKPLYLQKNLISKLSFRVIINLSEEHTIRKFPFTMKLISSGCWSYLRSLLCGPCQWRLRNVATPPQFCSDLLKCWTVGLLCSSECESQASELQLTCSVPKEKVHCLVKDIYNKYLPIHFSCARNFCTV